MDGTETLVYTTKEAHEITGLPRTILLRLEAKGAIRAGILPSRERRYWREDIVRMTENDPGARERIRRVDDRWSSE